MRRIPDHAISVWLEGDELKLGLAQPGSRPTAFLTLPLAKCSIEVSEFGQPLARQRGWLILIDLLKERARSGRKTIGFAANPVQYDVDQMLLAMAQTKRVVKNGKAEDILKELGL